MITISTNGGFNRRENETWLQALVRLIAYQMVEPDESVDRDNLFQCEEADLLKHLQAINGKGRAVVLLIDELNNMGVPLDGETSSFLTTHFLDKEGRYLIFSSHVQFFVDASAFAPNDSALSHVLTSRSGRTMISLPLPFCTDRNVLQNMIEDSVTDLKITLAVGIPSLLYVMSKPSRMEMSFQERFNLVMNQHLGKGRGSWAEKDFINTRRKSLLSDFLFSVISGKRGMAYFEAFSTPVDQERLRFPIPYIPIILQFLLENEGARLYESLNSSTETVETGRDWELVVIFAIYIRSLAAKHCKDVAGEELLRGPFSIATDGVEDVKVVTIPSVVRDEAQAVNYIREATQMAKTIYIFQLAYSKFPDFDGFVSYRATRKRHAEQESALTIHGFQCKLCRGYPRREVNTEYIARGWFLRGGTTVRTPDRNGWTFPTEEEIENTLLGFGLRILHPMNWGNVPENDYFD